MKVLCDEDLPHKLRLALGGHAVFTAAYMGWGGLRNGELLDAAQNAGFNVLLTGDQSMCFEQNLTGRHLAIVVLSAIEWRIIEPFIQRISKAISAARPGSITPVDCGRFRRTQ